MTVRPIIIIAAALGMIALCSLALAGVFDVFSIFGKKSKTIPTMIAPQVGAELKQENSFPAVDATLEPKMECQRMRYEGKLPNVRFYADKTFDVHEQAFIVGGLSDGRSIALINDPDKSCFNFWQMDDKRQAPVKIIETGKLDPKQDEWIINYFVDAACLPNGQLLVIINYANPRPHDALYIFDTTSMDIKFVMSIEADAQDSDHYFEHKILSEDAALVLHYSDRRRKSAEIYHNYLNHVVLFSSDYPNGLEVLKLSIDIGNIRKWGVSGNTLHMHTRDSRNHRDPKLGFWSLDLSKVLN